MHGYTEKQVELFWAKFAHLSPDECWPWPGALYKNGYGKVRVGSLVEGTRRLETTNRASLEMHLGHRLATGQWALHTCDNRPCCNPSHLFAGTRRDNVNDMVGKRRSAHGERSGVAVLTLVQVRAIMVDPRSCRKIALDYGVSSSQIHAIVSGKNWADDLRKGA